MIKLYCTLFIATLFISLSGGCRRAGTLEKDIKPGEATPSTAFSVAEGWDIYDGGGYRYGPSIIQNEDHSVDVWFAAPGDVHGKRVLNYQDAGAQSPVSLTGISTAAQRFKADDPFYGIAVMCPNWSTTNSSVRLSLYSWNSDYQTTLNGTALQSILYQNYEDNQYLKITKEEKFEAGEYLWVLSDPSGSAGVWKKEGNMPTVVNYLNGEKIEASFQAYQMLNKSSGLIFWDQVAYRRTSDGGKTWTPEEMVLQPTEGTMDEFSICDPGLVKIGNYYYLGYTSTEDSRMVFNHVYVARSESPTGPWEKWDGSGWSNDPKPVITFTGSPDAWGAGEPSMVVNHETLFFYYTWDDKEKDILQTRVATADIKESNWPGHLTYQGIAMDKSSIDGADHCDVKYRDDIKRYQAIHTASRLTKNSYIILWESADGITFHKKAEIRKNLKPFLHNCGWSGDTKGHIDVGKQQYLSYAYGPDWGNWKTAWHPIHFEDL